MASAVESTDVVHDLERAFATHSCPTGVTATALTADLSENVDVVSVLHSAVGEGSPVLGDLRTAYWSARRGAASDALTYELVDLAECFLDRKLGADRSRYAEALRQAMLGIAEGDAILQRIARSGSADVAGIRYTLLDLPVGVAELALRVVGDTSDAALAMVLELLAAGIPLLRHVTLGPQGFPDAEAGQVGAVNDAHVTVDETVTTELNSLPLPPDTVRKCAFRQTQHGDREGGTGQHTFTATTATVWGEDEPAYSLITYDSTYLYNLELKCLKFASMQRGTFEFVDRTPFPSNIACGWHVKEPYGYQTYYEFLPGFPNSGYMMRGIFDIMFACDTGVIPFWDVPLDRDCPYNNVYAHYDNGTTWSYGEPSRECPERGLWAQS